VQLVVIGFGTPSIEIYSEPPGSSGNQNDALALSAAGAERVRGLLNGLDA